MKIALLILSNKVELDGIEHLNGLNGHSLTWTMFNAKWWVRLGFNSRNIWVGYQEIIFVVTSFKGYYFCWNK